MRVLLDENLPRRLTREFDEGVEAQTVGQRGWKGTENGGLLRRAESKFDVFLTTDQGIPHQQNLEQLEIGIAILRSRSNRLSDLKPLMEEVNRRIRSLQKGERIEVAP
jgi:predicted nuclease of predicted toxin-antitoxin system